MREIFETNFGGTGARPGPKLKALSGQRLETGPVEGLGALRIRLSVVRLESLSEDGGWGKE